MLAALVFIAPLAAQTPRFIEHTIATGLKGGYQVVAADINHDGKPDLIALASGMPDLVWYENPDVGAPRHRFRPESHDQLRGGRYRWRWHPGDRDRMEFREQRGQQHRKRRDFAP